MCDWIEISLSCLLKSANLLQFQPLSSPSGGRLRLELAERPGWRVACASLIERCEPYWETTEYTSIHAWLGVQCLYEHKWAASCHDNFTSSFFTHSSVECAVAQQGRVITGKDWSGGSYKPQEKKLSFAKISASSGASQAGLWIKTSQFDIFSFYQTCFPCPCIVTLCQTLWAELARHTVPRISVGMLNPSTPYICQPQHLQIFQRWAQFIWWKEKVHGKFCTCATIHSPHW